MEEKTEEKKVEKKEASATPAEPAAKASDAKEESGAEKKEEFQLRAEAPAWTPAAESKPAPTAVPTAKGGYQNKHNSSNTNKRKQQQHHQPHISTANGISMPPSSAMLQQYLALQRQQQTLLQIAQLQQLQQLQGAAAHGRPGAVEQLMRFARQQQQSQLAHQQNQAQLALQIAQLRQAQQAASQRTLEESRFLQSLKEKGQAAASSALPSAASNPPKAESSKPAVITISGGRNVNFDDLTAGAVSTETGLTHCGDSSILVAMRARTNRPLSYIQFDQRTSAKDKTQGGVKQFVFRPISKELFKDLSAKESDGFHKDLSEILQNLNDPQTLQIQCGQWNWTGESFMYLTCSDFTSEVADLCPELKANKKDLPQARTDDSEKFVTKLVLENEKLKCFKGTSFAEGLQIAGDLRFLYQFLEDTFHDLQGFEIRIYNLKSGETEFSIKTQFRYIPPKGMLTTENGTVLDWNALPIKPGTHIKKDSDFKGALRLSKKTSSSALKD
eukprot:TRINITY_DN8990_c0_g1_i1.p1 TRINITY_DN8990_c0_g1~~TRINITY_DN8990_c0_g1_i1.p1  ORF type:complete len:501 (+),score=118.64 TRINITY_DN8990_c0_g1_i1:49-1551(+)